MISQSVNKLKEQALYFRCIAQDSRTPRISRILLLSAVAYLASPIDLVPDFIPVLGQIDDLVVVTTLIWFAMRLVPQVVKTDAHTESTRSS